jgi:transaldolase
VKLFLATDALDDVQWASARGWCDGVVLPDAALRTAATPDAAIAWLAAFARAVATPVLVDGTEVVSRTGATDAARALGRAADNVVLQCPFTDENALAVRDLAAAGVRVAMTFVASAAQALLAAKAGAAFVLIDVDRLEAISGSGARVVAESRALLDAAALETELVALFPPGASSLAACGAAGADAAVVGAATLRALLAYPFAESAVSDADRRPAGGQRLHAGEP